MLALGLARTRSAVLPVAVGLTVVGLAAELHPPGVIAIGGLVWLDVRPSRRVAVLATAGFMALLAASDPSGAGSLGILGAALALAGWVGADAVDRVGGRVAAWIGLVSMCAATYVVVPDTEAISAVGVAVALGGACAVATRSPVGWRTAAAGMGLAVASGAAGRPVAGLAAALVAVAPLAWRVGIAIRPGLRAAPAIVLAPVLVLGTAARVLDQQVLGAEILVVVIAAALVPAVAYVTAVGRFLDRRPKVEGR